MIKKVGIMLELRRLCNRTPIHLLGSGTVEYLNGPTTIECRFRFEVELSIGEWDRISNEIYVIDNNHNIYTVSKDDPLFPKFEKYCGRLVEHNCEVFDNKYVRSGLLQFGDFATVEQCKEISTIEYIESKSW